MQETLIAPSTGRGAVQIDLGQKGVDLLDLPNFTYTGGTITHTPNMWAVGEHQLQAASHTAYNSTLGKLLNTEDRQVRYRLGIIGGDQTIWTGWTTGRVTVCRADVSRINKSGDGFAFSIRICDQLVRLNQENKVKARRGKISDIIQQIAVENGITDFSIEPTAGIYNMVQSYETDFDFMLRITAMAVNASGIGGYTFYLVNDILHFHTNPWQTQGIKVLRANSDPEAPLWSVQFTDQVQAAIDGGGAGYDITVSDPLAGTVKSTMTSQDKSTKFSNVSFKFPPTWTEPFRSHAGQNQVQAELDLAQVAYCCAHLNAYALSIGTTNVVGLSLGDLVKFDLPPDDPLAGLYALTSVIFSQSGGGLNVVAGLSRGEMGSVDAKAKVPVNSSQDTPPAVGADTAPGKPVDLATAAASPATRLSGPTTAAPVSATTVKVQNPATLPTPPTSSNVTSTQPPAQKKATPITPGGWVTTTAADRAATASKFAAERPKYKYKGKVIEW